MIDQIQQYWNTRIHDLEMTDKPVGSLEFFDDLDEYRFDKLQSVPSFSGSLMPLVDQSGPQPRLLGAPIYESSSMATATGAGTRVVCYGDFSQNYIVDRWPSHVLFEPMVVGTGAGAQFPTGLSGWFFFARSGMGQTTTGAWRVGKN